MRRTENKDIARLMFASITRPINAALAGAGTLFTVAGLSNHPLGVVGMAMLVGTMAFVGRDISNKEFVQEVLNEGSQPKALPEIPESLAGQYRLHCLEAKRHLEKTVDAMQTGGPEMMEELRPLRDQIMEYVESVYRLAERAHHIDGFLALSSRNEINKEIEKIKAQLVLTSDPVSRKHLERTREQKEEQLTTYDELALRVKRILAQMGHINATLETVQLKAMKISSSDLKTGVSQSDEVTATLQSLLDEVKLFERSLDAAADDPALAAPGTLQDWDVRAASRKGLAAAPGIDRDILPGEGTGPSNPGLWPAA